MTFYDMLGGVVHDEFTWPHPYISILVANVGDLQNLLILGALHPYVVEFSSQKQIASIKAFIVENIFVQLGGRMIQQTVGIQSTSWAPLLAGLSFYSQGPS